MPVAALFWGLVATVALRQVHDGIFAHGGLWVIGTLLGGATLASLQAWRRKRRLAARAPIEAAVPPGGAS